jgi:hypothetical protein
MKTERYITFNLSDDSIWGLPLKLIAHHRATQICADDPKTTYEDEFHYVMRDSFEGIDWFKNNMNPDDVPLHEYVRLGVPKPKGFLDRVAECDDIHLQDLPAITAESEFKLLSQVHDAVGVE